jgi:hypothetical protein
MNLNSGELFLGKLHPPPHQGRPQPKLRTVDREFSSADDSWSSRAPRAKSDDLDLAGSTGNRHAIVGKFAGPVEEDLA